MLSYAIIILLDVYGCFDCMYVMHHMTELPRKVRRRHSAWKKFRETESC